MSAIERSKDKSRKRKIKERRRELVRNQTEAALSVAGRLSSEQLQKNSNLVFSPLSINMVLSLVAAGAGGECRRELLGFLKAGSVEDLNELYSDAAVSGLFADAGPSGGPTLSVANGVWIQEGLSLNRAFNQAVDDVYKACSCHVDFQTKPEEEIRSQVNSWAEKHTNGLVRNILPPKSITEATKLILANALYFKAPWARPFNSDLTEEDDFNLLGGDSIRVSFMSSNSSQLISTFGGFRVLGLHYKSGKKLLERIFGDDQRFSMYIFLPDSNDGLPALMEKLWSETGFIERHLPRELVPVGEFKLPKFKLSFNIEASKTLNQLGVELLFKPGGLTEMLDSPDESGSLRVLKIYHKACIEVDEERAEAAAATVAYMVAEDADGSSEESEPPETVDFVADHPFAFVVRENITGVVLFAGHVLNPLNQD